MDDEPRRKKIKSVGSTYGTLRNKIQKRLHQNYPFLQQSGVYYLADTILQHEFYKVRQDHVVLWMSRLLRHLEGPTNDPIEKSKRRNVLSHLHRPVPLVRQQDKADFQLLLHAHQYLLRQQKAASQSWERLYYLMMLAYKFRHNV